MEKGTFCYTVDSLQVQNWGFLTCVEFNVCLACVAEHSNPAALPLFCSLQELFHTMEKGGRGKKRAICSCRWGFVDGVQVAVTE